MLQNIFSPKVIFYCILLDTFISDFEALAISMGVNCRHLIQFPKERAINSKLFLLLLHNFLHNFSLEKKYMENFSPTMVNPYIRQSPFVEMKNFPMIIACTISITSGLEV